jgi:hypothetical protein
VFGFLVLMNWPTGLEIEHQRSAFFSRSSFGVTHMSYRLVSLKKLMPFGWAMAMTVLLGSGAQAAVIKIDKHQGSVDAKTAKFVDGAIAKSDASMNNWGRTVAASNSASQNPKFFNVESAPSSVVFNGAGNPVLAGNSQNVIPASLMNGKVPAGLQNVANGLKIAAPETTPVPLPAAVWLFITALVSLVMIGRQRRQYAASPQ